MSISFPTETSDSRQADAFKYYWETYSWEIVNYGIVWRGKMIVRGDLHNELSDEVYSNNCRALRAVSSRSSSNPSDYAVLEIGLSALDVIWEGQGFTKYCCSRSWIWKGGQTRLAILIEHELTSRVMTWNCSSSSRPFYFKQTFSPWPLWN